MCFVASLGWLSSTDKIYREIARPSQFMLSTNTQALCVVCVCFRPPRITILCSRLNRKPSTQILDPKNLRSLLRKNLVSNLAILGPEVNKSFFPFQIFFHKIQCNLQPSRRGKREKKYQVTYFSWPFFTFIRWRRSRKCRDGADGRDWQEETSRHRIHQPISQPIHLSTFFFIFFLGTIVANSLYDLKDQYSPKQMTLRKIAMVNNNSFGAYAIQMGLDKFLIGVNQGTSKQILKFKAIQIANQHRSPNEVMKFLNLNFFLLYY